jgi:hypothetical protein
MLRRPSLHLPWLALGISLLRCAGRGTRAAFCFGGAIRQSGRLLGQLLEAKQVQTEAVSWAAAARNGRKAGVTAVTARFGVGIWKAYIVRLWRSCGLRRFRTAQCCWIALRLWIALTS